MLLEKNSLPRVRRSNISLRMSVIISNVDRSNLRESLQ